MAGSQMIIILGNLGKDPETRYSPTGMAITKFSVAVGERVKDGDNGWKDKTEWFNVVCFGKTAENAGQYLTKGRQVQVIGRQNTNEYEKDGQKKRFTELVADRLTFVGGGEGGGSRGGGGGGRRSEDTSTSTSSGGGGGDGFIDDDVPF